MVFEIDDDIDPVEAHGKGQQERLRSPLVMETTEPDSNIKNYADSREQFLDDIDNETSPAISEEIFKGAWT